MAEIDPVTGATRLIVAGGLGSPGGINMINQNGNMAFGPGNRYHIIMQPNIKGMRGFSLGAPYVWYLWKDKS